MRAVVLGCLCLLTILNVVVGQSGSAIIEWDEARHGVSAAEMVASGDWIVPTYAGQPDLWNLKPPLGIWLIAGGMSLGVEPVWALRLPAMLAALGCVLLLFQLGSRMHGVRVGAAAAAALACCFPFICIHGARTGDFDAQLSLVVLGAVLLALGKPSIGRSIGIGALLACGFLLKSFAIGPWAVGVVLVYARQAPALGSWTALILAASLPCLGWAALRMQADGIVFLRTMIDVDLLKRGATQLETSTWSAFHYLAFLGDRLAPWSAVPILAFGCVIYARFGRRRAAALRNMERPDWWLYGAVILPALLLFSLARTQHHWYIYPAVPFLILFAVEMLHKFALTSRFAALSAIAITLAGVAFNEGRMIKRSMLGGRAPSEQVWLRTMDLGGATSLGHVDDLRQSERFVLQAERRVQLARYAYEAEFRQNAGPGALLLLRSGVFGHPYRLERVAVADPAAVPP